MIRRTAHTIHTKIHISQAAYQSERRITKLAFTVRTLVGKAITSQNYEAHHLMLHISQTFDIVERKYYTQI